MVVVGNLGTCPALLEVIVICRRHLQELQHAEFSADRKDNDTSQNFLIIFSGRRRNGVLRSFLKKAYNFFTF